MGTVSRGAEGLVAEGMLTVEMGALAEDLALGIHPHPTLSETQGEAPNSFSAVPPTSFTPGNKSESRRSITQVRRLCVLDGDEQVMGVLSLDDISAVDPRASTEVLQAITE
jgi:CBS domain-containing protein